jgi:hypothetical protein
MMENTGSIEAECAGHGGMVAALGEYVKGFLIS